MYVYSYNALSAQFFAVDRVLNSYFMIMIKLPQWVWAGTGRQSHFDAFPF